MRCIFDGRVNGPPLQYDISLYSFDFLPLGHGQLVAAVVFGVVGVAFDPMVVQFVPHGQSQQLLPQIRVQGRLFVGLDPALLFPAPGPALFQSINDVLGVGVQLHDTGLLQPGQSHDHGGELHPIVGGLLFAAGHLFFVGAVHQNGPPATRTGIAGTGAVRVNCYCFHS